MMGFGMILPGWMPQCTITLRVDRTNRGNGAALHTAARSIPTGSVKYDLLGYNSLLRAVMPPVGSYSYGGIPIPSNGERSVDAIFGFVADYLLHNA
jgi:hypothetical protein